MGAKIYKVVDIYHTGNSGEEFERKVGLKYDMRRDKLVKLDIHKLYIGSQAILTMLDKDEAFNKEAKGRLLVTTELEKIYREDDYLFLRTLNSIYKLEEYINDK